MSQPDAVRASERPEEQPSEARKRKLDDAAQAEVVAAESKLRRESMSSPVSTSSNAIELSALSPATPPYAGPLDGAQPGPSAAAGDESSKAAPQEQIRVKIKLAKRRPEEVDAGKTDVETMRTRAATKRQTILSNILAERERDIRELCMLKLLPNGGNVLEPSSFSATLPAEIAKYHQSHPLELEDTGIPIKKAPIASPTAPTTKAPKAPKASPKTPAAATPVSVAERLLAQSIEVADSPPATPSRGVALSVTKKVELSVEEIASKAAHDANILKRVRALQKEGLWLPKRMPPQQEPPRTKSHWDYLLEEMAWLAKDFQDERRWKIATGRKLSRAVAKHHKELELEEKKKTRDEEAALRRTASKIARDVKKFWQQIEKVVIFKAQQQEEEMKKAVREKQLIFLVGQTEKYSSMLAQELKPAPDQPAAAPPISVVASVAATATEAASKTTQPSTEKEDIELIDVKPAAPEDESSSSSEKPASVAELIRGEPAAEDAEEFKAEEGGDEDDVEDTLEAEEKLAAAEAGGTETNETAQLENEGKMPIEEVLKTYYGDASLDEGIEDEEEEEEDGDDEGAVADDDSRSEKQIIDDAAKEAAAAQPTGFTLDTTKVKTKVPHLLRGSLREYQHVGLEWLASMYEKKLNGILADEMGLGKTIMSISILAHLACEKGIWGPHLVIVPTSVMINWEAEFKKWCPAFKILVYFGSQKERRLKRQGWSKPNSFHVCITSYKLVIQDAVAFRRKKWKYLILDEAQNIKNFRSQRWQVLLNFNAQRRLLLTGTPLQNSLMELWSLMHFLMPNIFQSHQEFKEWFSKPVNQIIEGQEDYNADLINRLHAVLRPFILRRLKKDVEKQLPSKHEHIVPCPLSKRQRFLYDEFMASASTQSTLSSGNFLGIINVLMQLRKVCNHPDLFESRPIVSPYDQASLVLHVPSISTCARSHSPLSDLVDLDFLGLSNMPARERAVLSLLRNGSSTDRRPLIVELGAPDANASLSVASNNSNHAPLSPLDEMKQKLAQQAHKWHTERFNHVCYINARRSTVDAVYGDSLLRLLTIPITPRDYASTARNPLKLLDLSDSLLAALPSYDQRSEQLRSLIEQFVFLIPKVRAAMPVLHASHPDPSAALERKRLDLELTQLAAPRAYAFWAPFVRTQLYFPDKRLIQYDCGKLQRLALLLRDLKAGGHRALIFTQMTKMLDVLEIFLNLHGHTYLRLDGSTKVEHRQKLTERFNRDTRIFLFILSTRSGGLGLNLTGADTVIFYDSDWNPAMDAQAQDRCHRIGQTREVHIYRLVSEYTIEENILKKATQKRYLDEVVIQEGQFTTDFFKKIDLTDLISAPRFASASTQTSVSSPPKQPHVQISQQEWEKAAAAAEDENDVLALQQAKKEQAQELDEFDEEKMAREEAAAAKAAAQGTPAKGASSATGNGADIAMGEEDGMLADAKTITENKRKAEQGGIDEMLTGVQRYMMRFVESGATGAVELVEVIEQPFQPPPVYVDPELEIQQLDQGGKQEDDDEEEVQLFYQAKSSYHTLSYCVLIYGPPIPPDADELFTPDLSLLFGAVISEAPDKSASKSGDAAATTKKGTKRRALKATSKANTTTNADGPKKTALKRSLKESATDEAGLFGASRKRKVLKGRQRGDAEEARADHAPWTVEEDTVLLETLEEYGRNWDLIAECVNALPFACACRSRRQCETRHRLVLQPRQATPRPSDEPPAPTLPTTAMILEFARKEHAKPPFSTPAPLAPMQDTHNRIAEGVGVTPDNVPWPQALAIRNMRPIPVPSPRDRFLEALQHSIRLDYKLSQLTPGVKPPPITPPIVPKPAAAAAAAAAAQNSQFAPLPVSVVGATTTPKPPAMSTAAAIPPRIMKPGAVLPVGITVPPTATAAPRFPGALPMTAAPRPVAPTALATAGYGPMMPQAAKAKAKRMAKPKPMAHSSSVPLSGITTVPIGMPGSAMGAALTPLPISSPVAPPAALAPGMQVRGVSFTAGVLPMKAPTGVTAAPTQPHAAMTAVPPPTMISTYVPPPTAVPASAAPAVAPLPLPLNRAHTAPPTAAIPTYTTVPYYPGNAATAASMANIAPLPLRQPTILRAPSPVGTTLPVAGQPAPAPIPLPLPLPLTAHSAQPPPQPLPLSTPPPDHPPMQ